MMLQMWTFKHTLRKHSEGMSSLENIYDGVQSSLGSQRNLFQFWLNIL